MEKFFGHLPAVLVFLTLAAFSWLFGGSRSSYLLPVMPWVWVFTCEALLFFPQRRPYEDLVTARGRVWRALRRDPLLYVVLAFLLLLAIPFLNQGLCPTCDYPQILAGANPNPPMPYLPFCVDWKAHLNVVIWFLPAFTAMLAAKHALSRAGKRLLVEMMAWNGAALAALGLVQIATDAGAPLWTGPKQTVHFFSVFGYPNMGGSFFVMMFAFSIGTWLTHAAEVAAEPRRSLTKGKQEDFFRRFFRAHYMLLAALFNFFAVLNTLCRAAMTLLIALTALAFVYHEVALLLSHHDRARRVKKAAYVAGGAIALLVVAFIFAPPDVGRELSSITGRNMLDRVAKQTDYHSRVALQMVRDRPLFGVGGWGYKHFSIQYLTDAEMEHMYAGGANVHNDSMQFIVEHGFAGALLLLGIVLLLVGPLMRDWYRLYRAARFTKGAAAPPSPRGLYCFPPGAFWVLAGDVCVYIHSFGDCPLRSAAVLSCFFVSLACAEGFIPREIEEPEHRR